MKAKNLRILVIRDGDEKVNISMPAISSKWIIDLMSDDILEKIQSQGIDIQGIQHRLNQTDEIMQQELFILTTREKSIRVWLE